MTVRPTGSNCRTPNAERLPKPRSPTFRMTNTGWLENGATNTDRVEKGATNTGRLENGATNTRRLEKGVTNTGPCRCLPGRPPKKFPFSNRGPAKAPLWNPKPGLDIENLAPAGNGQWPALQPG